MDVSAFQQLIARLTAQIADMPPGAALAPHLNARHNTSSALAPTFTRGRALLLSLLPPGAIQFSPAAAA